MIPSMKWFCLETIAQDKFMPTVLGQRSVSGCLLEEFIEFECPLFLIPLCQSELYSQRSKVHDNLQIHIEKIEKR